MGITLLLFLLAITFVPILYAKSEEESMPKNDIIKFDNTGMVIFVKNLNLIDSIRRF